MFKAYPYNGEISLVHSLVHSFESLYFSKMQLDYMLTEINRGYHDIPISFDRVKSGEIPYTVVSVITPRQKYYKIKYDQFYL